MAENTDPLDTEANLFDTLSQGNDYDDEEDDDDLLIEKSFSDFDESEEEEEESEEEEELFEEEESEEEEEEFDQKELDLLNKKLGTDFKSVEDLKKEFNLSEKESETEKENAEYKTLTNKVSLYEKYIGMDNEELIRNQMLSEAAQDKKDIEDPDVLEDIEEKIRGLIDLNQLNSMADTLRSNLQNQKEKTMSSIEKIDNRRVESENEIARKNTEALQDAFADIFSKKEFLGVTVKKEDIKDAYQSIKTNKFFDSVNGNQEMIAKFAMFLKYEEEISKLTNRPTHSDKVKDEFNFLSGNDKKQRRSIAQANGSASSGGAIENLKSFLK